MYLHANLYEFGICRILGQLYFKTTMTTFRSCEKQERAFLCLQYENLVELLKVKCNKNVTEAP